jgi:hypothetical protein
MGKHKDPEVTGEAGAEAPRDPEVERDEAVQPEAAADRPAEQAGDEARRPEDARAEELAEHEAVVTDLAEQVAEERGHRTLYATLFYVLLGAVAVVGVTLWGAPKVAPHLPGVVAQYLMPGQIETAGRLAALEAQAAARAQETEAALAALREELAALATRVEAAAPADATGAAIAEVREAAEAAAGTASELASRIDGIETRLAGLREEVAAVSATLAGAGGGAAPPELAAGLAALRARLDQLTGSVEGGPPAAELAGRLAALVSRVETLEASLAEAQEVRGEVSSAIRQTRLQAALDTLAGRIAAGQPYGGPLGEAAAVSGSEPPEALAAGAESGLATAAELETAFGRHAQAAIAADIRAASGKGAGSRLLGWLRAQVAGRPIAEQEGGTVPAITSRIAARLAEGKLEAALSEAETLPPAAQEAMAGWLGQLRARVAAERALAEWRDRIAAGG